MNQLIYNYYVLRTLFHLFGGLHVTSNLIPISQNSFLQIAFYFISSSTHFKALKIGAAK